MKFLGPFALPNYPEVLEFYIGFVRTLLKIHMMCNKNFSNSIFNFTTFFMVWKLQTVVLNLLLELLSLVPRQFVL